MTAALEITHGDLDAGTLRRQATRAGNGDVARRLLALALIAEGKTRKEAANAAGMDRQTLRDWVLRYNAHGIAGLADRKPPGRRPALNTAQLEELAEWVRQGPDAEQDGIVRWRRCDLAGRIAERFGVTLNERSVGKILQRLGFSHVSVRPRHPRQDEQALEAHKKTSASWSLP